jgi:hypothetical protein
MVAGAVAGNISAEATSPSGNIFTEAMRGAFSSIAGIRWFILWISPTRLQVL